MASVLFYTSSQKHRIRESEYSSKKEWTYCELEEFIEIIQKKVKRTQEGEQRRKHQRIIIPSSTRFAFRTTFSHPTKAWWLECARQIDLERKVGSYASVCDDRGSMLKRLWLKRSWLMTVECLKKCRCEAQGSQRFTNNHTVLYTNNLTIMNHHWIITHDSYIPITNLLTMHAVITKH